MGRSPHLGGFAFEGDRDIEVAQQAMQRTGVLHLAISVWSRSMSPPSTRTGAESNSILKRLAALRWTCCFRSSRQENEAFPNCRERSKFTGIGTRAERCGHRQMVIPRSPAGKARSLNRPRDFRITRLPLLRQNRQATSITRPGGGMADTKVLEAFAVRCAGSNPFQPAAESVVGRHRLRG